MQHHVVEQLSPVQFDRAGLAQLVALIETAFRPEKPTFRFRDWSIDGTARANSLEEFLDHPELPSTMGMLRVTARCTDDHLGEAKVDVIFDNAGSAVHVHATHLPWAKAVADNIRSFSFSHRPWHFFMRGRIGVGLVCLATGSVGLFILRLAQRIFSGTMSLDFVSMWLAILTASIAICVAGILLPEVEIRLGNEPEAWIRKQEKLIMIFSGLSVLTWVARYIAL